MMNNKKYNNKQSEHLKPMPKDLEYEFKRLLKVQSSSNNEKRMIVFIANILKELNVPYIIDEIGNLLVTKGELKDGFYPCIVSHLDTVYSIIDSFDITEYINHKNSHTILKAKSDMKYVGIGGDDKCGIYACLLALKNINNIKAVFFTKEELGLQGSTGVDHDFFEDVGYVLQLDRWGRGDFIDQYFNEFTTSTEFQEVAQPIKEKYGYISTEGLITDCMELWSNEVGVSCINISCGYYNHHTNSEYIDLHQFYNSLRFVLELIKKLGENLYESVPDFNYSSYGHYTNQQYGISCPTDKCDSEHSRYRGSFFDSGEKMVTCDLCNRFFKEEDTITIYKETVVCWKCTDEKDLYNYIIPDTEKITKHECQEHECEWYEENLFIKIKGSEENCISCKYYDICVLDKKNKNTIVKVDTKDLTSDLIEEIDK